MKLSQLLQDYGFIDMPTRISGYLRNPPDNIQIVLGFILQMTGLYYSAIKVKQGIQQENIKREAFKKEMKFFQAIHTS